MRVDDSVQIVEKNAGEQIQSNNGEKNLVRDQITLDSDHVMQATAPNGDRPDAHLPSTFNGAEPLQNGNRDRPIDLNNATDQIRISTAPNNAGE